MSAEFKLSYTGQEIDEKLGKVDKTILYTEQTLTEDEQAQARDNIGASAEHQTFTTDVAYEHKDLPVGNKTVSVHGDGVFGNDCFACAGVDLVPRKTFNRKFPYNGITITRNDMTFHIEGTATKTTYIVFTQDPTQIRMPIDSRFIGKKLKLTTFANMLVGGNILLDIQFYDADGNVVKVIDSYGQEKNSDATYIGKDKLMYSLAVIVPSGAAYYRLQLGVSTTNEINFDFQIYLTEAELTQSAPIGESTLIGNASDSDNIITFPYQSTVTVEASIAEYVKYMARNAKGDKATYIMPETFGAIGDGYADDSEAIALCLATAFETKQTVLMARKYCITQPIILSNDGLNIIANDIVYTGTDTAIKISGQKNTIKVHSIESSGVGIFYRADNNKFVCYNDVEVNTIKSNSHGIVFYNGLTGIYQNTVKFNYIEAGGSDTYGICMLDIEGDSWVTENNFYGGHISNCDWAVYKIRGNSKLYGIQVERNVQGGFYIIGDIVIFYPRLAESARDGSFPFFKFMQTVNTWIYSDSPISINEIDLSECAETQQTGGDPHPLTEGHCGIINAQITTRIPAVGKNIEAGVIYSDKAYVWGKRLIITPSIAYKKVVTTETLNTRLIGTEEDFAEIKALSQLPTKFVVDNINTEIYLHASYCAFGFNKFEVEQANGFTCKIYDYDQNLIFDGAEYGNGTYKISVYKDASLAEQDYGVMWVDNLYQCWNVEPVLSIEDVEEYGFSPVANVTQTDGGAVISVTDKNGTTIATIANGKDGAKGDKGDKGDAGASGKTPVRGTDYWTEADKEDIIQQVLAELGAIPVFGRVDENNNIILTAALADGVYTLKYVDIDGNVTEIGTLNHSNVPEVTYTNLFDPATATLNQRMSGTTSAPKAQNGYVITALIPIPETAVTKTSNTAFIAVPSSMWSGSANMFLAKKDGTATHGYCGYSITKGEVVGAWVKIPLLNEWGKDFTCNGVTISLYVKGSAITAADIQNIEIYFNECPE